MIRNLYLSFLVLLVSSPLFAQFTPKDKWEVGVGLGHAMITGDLNYAPGVAGSFHVRKSLDYIFSLRADFQGSLANSKWNGSKQRGDGFKTTNTTMAQGSLQLVASINNMVWRTNAPNRKNNLYVFGGGGANFFQTKSDKIATATDSRVNPTIKFEPTMQIEAGAGMAFRLSPKMNIAFEHKISNIRSSNRADLLDGVERFGANAVYRELTQFPDVLHYTNVRLNFNLGKGEAEPLWWVNPMAPMLDEVAALKARPVFDLTDTDGDGVIDMIDQEKETPAGAAVDTRGVVLDSDADGLPNYKDMEPFSPIGFKIDAKGVAQVPKDITESQINGMIDSKLAGYTPKGAATTTTTSMGDWFLPMIHFDLDRYNVKTSEFAALRSVATVMKANPSVRVVVSGYTDRTAGNAYNEVLSFNRANAAIDHLVTVYGIDRSRLVLNFGGESDNLVPTNAQTMMNRRVEFRVAQGGESDMARPAGKAGRGNTGGRTGF